jgi:uncharacterized protein
MKLNINEVKDFYISYGGLSGHGFDHIERVFRIAKLLGKSEKADMVVVEAAALLHDIARAKENDRNKLDHAIEGAKMAAEYLKKINFPETKLKNVIHCIATHRVSKGKKAQTLEAKILQDADRLDALGAIIIARAFTYNGKNNRPVYDPSIKPAKTYKGNSTTIINHFYEKILKLKPNSFHTRLAQKFAKKRYAFVVNFIKQFTNEWSGKDLNS